MATSSSSSQKPRPALPEINIIRSKPAPIVVKEESPKDDFKKHVLATLAEYKSEAAEIQHKVDILSAGPERDEAERQLEELRHQQDINRDSIANERDFVSVLACIPVSTPDAKNALYRLLEFHKKRADVSTLTVEKCNKKILELEKVYSDNSSLPELTNRLEFLQNEIKSAEACLALLEKKSNGAATIKRKDPPSDESSSSKRNKVEKTIMVTTDNVKSLLTEHKLHVSTTNRGFPKIDLAESPKLMIAFFTGGDCFMQLPNSYSEFRYNLLAVARKQARNVSWRHCDNGKTCAFCNGADFCSIDDSEE